MVHGWTLPDYPVPANRRRFLFHSVVANVQGRLLDVTCTAADGALQLIQHPEPAEHFLALLGDGEPPFVVVVVVVVGPEPEFVWLTAEHPDDGLAASSF